MTMARGRVLQRDQAMHASSVARAETIPASEAMSVSGVRGRIERRERVEVAQRAAAMLATAREQAAELVREAEEQAERTRQTARQEGLEQGAAQLATAWLLVQKREAEADQHDLDRSVIIARLLAERLIGQSLRLDPAVVAGLAREAMHHLWRSRKVTIHAHPDDVPALEEHLATFGLPPERVCVVPDEERGRGCLRFKSDFGELDGDIGPQLDRLADAIRQELRPG